MFESGSTSLERIAIVQVFDEHLYDRKGNIVSTMTVAASQEGTRRPHLQLVSEESLASVYDIRQAPSARRRRELLRNDDPSMRRRPVIATHSSLGLRRPVIATHSSLGLRRLVSGALAFIAATGIAVGAGLALQTQPYDGPTHVVSVASGDSVWSLAQGVSTTRPLKDVVNDIKELNDVQGALQVGQEVRVPTR